MAREVRFNVARRPGGLEMSSAIRKFMDDAREKLIDRLIDAAISTLHHDTSDGDDVDKYERRVLREKFLAAFKADGY